MEFQPFLHSKFVCLRQTSSNIVENEFCVRFFFIYYFRLFVYTRKFTWVLLEIEQEKKRLWNEQRCSLFIYQEDNKSKEMLYSRLTIVYIWTVDCDDVTIRIHHKKIQMRTGAFYGSKLFGTISLYWTFYASIYTTYYREDDHER